MVTAMPGNASLRRMTQMFFLLAVLLGMGGILLSAQEQILPDFEADVSDSHFE
jgi:hypothetical protein